MPDPRFETAIDLAKMELVKCYRPGGKREFDRNSPEGLRKTISHCHDVNQRIINAEGEQWLRIAKLEARDERKTLMIWILGGVLTGACTLLGYVVELLVRG